MKSSLIPICLFFLVICVGSAKANDPCPNCVCDSTTTSTTITISTSTTTSTTVSGDCSSYSINVEFLGQGYGGDITETKSDTPSCLKQLIDEKKAKCIPYGQPGTGHYGSCLLMELSGHDVATEWSTFFSGVGDYYYDSTTPASFKFPGQLTTPGRQGYGQYYSGNGLYYRDKIFFSVGDGGICNVLKENELPGNVTICEMAKMTWRSSPISLLIGTDLQEFQQESRMVNFALGPNKGSYSIWKGSSKAPLLVYDQKHTGVIDSATQLFGDWTFGGKREASLNISTKTVSDKDKPSVAWENGYEALGVLDSNKDGKISGEELDPLALWFDENRNAKSELGEVKQLSEVGIIALYYKEYRKDELSQDVVARVGFDRVVDNKTITGTSVDWYGVSANSEVELMQKQLGINNICNLNKEPFNIDSNKNDSESLEASSKVDPDFYGVWNWKSETKEVESAGVLVFADNTKGGILGMSLMELSLDSSNKQKVILSSMLNSKVIRDINDKSNSLVFSFKGKDGSVLESKAIFSNDKSTLKGSSVAYTLNGNNRRVTKAEYQWTAVRK